MDKQTIHIKNKQVSPIFNSSIKSKDIDSERRIIFVASSSKQDRHYETVDVASLKLPLKGGGFVTVGSIQEGGIDLVDVPLMLNHSFDVTDVIGSVRRAYYENEELIFECGISERDVAQDVLKLLEEGHLSNSFSITMADYDYNFESETISNAEVVEVSVVYRAANKEARIVTVKSIIKEQEMEKDQKIAELEKQLAESEQSKADLEAKLQEQSEKTDTSKSEETEKQEDNQENKEKKMDKDEIKKQVKDPSQEEVLTATTEKQLDKYDFTAKQFMAFVQKDAKTLAELNKQAVASYGQHGVKIKGNLMTAGAVEDGGAIVPSAELMKDVFTTLETISSVAGDLRVVTLESGNSISYASLLNDVIIKEVDAEGGKKAATKLKFAKGNLALREFAGIAVLTKKLVRQAAINIYDILVESFARAIANKRASMALTDAKSGLYKTTGVTKLETAADIPTWDEVRSMPYKVAAAAARGAKYYISRQLLEVLDTNTKDKNGRDLEVVKLNGDGLSGTFKNGFPFVVEDVLGDDKNHAVFGNMSTYGVLLRQGNVESETFDAGEVEDEGSIKHNLLQENKMAHRLAFYENVGYPIPSAFVITVNEQ
jgi:phage capsid family|nr:MAG TPA: major capsid protein [Caudoviricetes sp.]